MNELELYWEKVIDEIRHIDENEREHRLARKLRKILEYREYRKFLPVINKAKASVKRVIS